MKTPSRHPSPVGLWAFRMSLGTLVSRILGLFRDVGIAWFFTRSQTDIFFVAFRFPNFFRRALGEGAFSAGVTPALSEALCQKDGKRRATALSSVLFTMLFLTASLLTAVGVIFMDDIMEFLFADSPYSAVEGKLSQTIQAGRVVFVYLFLASSYSYFMSVAQALGRFFLPALAPALFNLSLIVFTLLPQEKWPFPALSLACGVLAGGVFQVALALFVLYKANFWPRFSLQTKGLPVRSTLNRLLPAVLGLSGLSLIGLINVYFAGRLPEGSHTYIYYGDRLLELPRSLIAVSVGSALVPALARLKAKKRLKEFLETTGYYLDFLIFLTLPCAVVLALLARPIVETLFERGQFDETATVQTACVVQIYSLVLIFSSGGRALASGFFSADKNWLCALASGAYVLLHGVLAGPLTANFGLPGLTGAVALSSLFYFCLLLYLLTRSVGALPLGLSARRFAGNLPGLALLTLILLCYQPLLSLLRELLPLWWSRLSALFILLSLGGGGYVLTGLLLNQEPAREFVRLLSFKKQKNRETHK